MTNAFWVALVALTALALAFVFYPLFFSSGAQRRRVDRQGQNLDNYRYRLAELEADRDAQRVDMATFAVLKDELDAALLEDMGNSSATAAGAQESSRARLSDPARERRAVLAVVLTCLVALPLLSFVLYEHWGASDVLAQSKAMRSIENSGPISQEQLEEMLVDLRAHLEQNPENPDGWALLARTNMQLQRYQAAAAAYQGLAQSLGGDPMAATAWGLVAQAHYLDSQRQWSEAVTNAIEQARAINPDEVNSLGLLGIAAFEEQNYPRAATYWRRILKVAPDYPQAESIANGIASAYRAMGQEVPPEVQQLLTQGAGPATDMAGQKAAQPQQDAAAPAASVQVQVGLSPNLPRPPADASVFIFARAVEGPPMPLAVARVKASELPVTVTLDDSLAMMPEARLSGADRVVLGARISESGTATPSPGDLEGLSEPVAVSADMGTVSLTIDSQRF